MPLDAASETFNDFAPAEYLSSAGGIITVSDAPDSHIVRQMAGCNVGCSRIIPACTAATVAPAACILCIRRRTKTRLHYDSHATCHAAEQISCRMASQMATNFATDKRPP